MLGQYSNSISLRIMDSFNNLSNNLLTNFNNKILTQMDASSNKNQLHNLIQAEIGMTFEQYQPYTQSGNEQQQQSYPPLCLDPKNEGLESRNTPISRLTEITYHSELKANNQSGKPFTNYLSQNNKQNGAAKNNENKQDLRMQVRNLYQLIADLKCYSSVLEKRNEELAILLQKQKLKSSHFQQALNLIRKQDNHLDRKINQQTEHFTKLRQQFEEQKDRNLYLTQKLEQSTAENNYLKQLILIANSNYETLEKKYLTAGQRMKKIEQENLSKQKQITCNMHEMKNLLANFIHTQGVNPVVNANISFGEHDENLMKKMPLSTSNRNQKIQTEELYRKMFIKTLKNKK